MPDWKARVRQRLEGLRLDPATQVEVVEELTQHVDDRYRDLLGRGVPEDVAAVQAWNELEGHPRLTPEISAARRALTPVPVQDTSRHGLTAFWDDVVFAWRRLRHAPGFAFVAILTVMLTVGANTAILSVADAVLFRPLPYADPEQIAILDVKDRKTGRHSSLIPYAYLDAINVGCPSISEVALIEPYEGQGPDQLRPSIQTNDGEFGIPTETVTPNYFTVLGVRAWAGRLFTDADAGREGVAAVLSHSAWVQLTGGDHSAIGKSLTLGRATFDLLGVLPPGFEFPSAIATLPSLVVLRKPMTVGDPGGTFHPVVRLAPGTTFARAQAEAEAAVASTIVPREDGRVSVERPDWSGIVPAVNDVRSILYPRGRSIMRFLLAAAIFILLLGCANLANMMVVRGRRRLQETAVRLALGASRARLVRPAVFEALIIGLGGAVLAVITTSALFDTLIRAVPRIAYGRASIGVDSRVWLISLGLGLFCAFSFSIIPALRATGIDVAALIHRRGGRGSQIRIGRPLVAVQVAIAVAVVFGAVVAGRAFVSILQIPIGFSPERVLRIMVVPHRDQSGADRRAAIDQIVEALARRPDVEAVGAAGSIPFSGRAPDDGLSAEGEKLRVGIVYALPGYFETIGVKAARGQLWRRGDAQISFESIVLSETAARVLFHDRDPIGATLSNGRDRQFRVVAVVGDVRNAIDREVPPIAYALPPPGRGALTILAKMRERTGRGPDSIKADTRQSAAIRSVTADWWEDRVSGDNAYQNPRFQTIVLAGLAVLALTLTALGIFTVMAYLVAARTREMGVRLAIGASPQSLVRLIVGQSLLPVTAGLGGGALLIVWGRKLAEAQLFNVDTKDSLSIAAAFVTIVLAAIAAAYLPARRATKINPTDVLRSE